MDTTITGIGAVVVGELRSAGYRESTVGQYEKTIKALREYAARSGADAYTSELGARFASLTTSPRTGRFSAQRRFDYRRLVALFDTYVVTGRVELAARKRGGGGPQPRSSAFMALNSAWEADMDGRGLAQATRAAYGRVARSYLVFLEAQGIYCLDCAEGASVLGFLESLSDRWATSSLFWVVSNFRPFLKFTGRTNLVDAINLAGVKRSRALVPVLRDEDERLAVHACASGTVSARDAAMTLLALTTGLRACDIIGLRLSNIDWRGQTLDRPAEDTQPPEGAAGHTGDGQARRLRTG